MFLPTSPFACCAEFDAVLSSALQCCAARYPALYMPCIGMRDGRAALATLISNLKLVTEDDAL